MRTPTSLKIDQDAPAAEAGDKVWQRGQAYAEEGPVEVLATWPTKVTTQAHGTETYATSSSAGGRYLKA